MDEARQRQRALDCDSELLTTCQFEGMIGRSPLMWEMFARIRRVAPHFRTALITGATGTGKELVARALHQLSPVSGGRYVVCNCSAVVETLFESELFGYVKGAFTGANQDKMGLFEYAHGGTLFLDEIGDMPLTTQAKLLRVLQNQEVQRVGSLTPRKVDVRVIAATNHDLQALIAEKPFPRGSVLPALDGGDSDAPRWPSERRICRCWSTTSFASSPRSIRSPSRGSRSARRSCWRGIPGRATCASWKMCSGTPA